MGEYICDDRLNRTLLMEDISKMSDAEFDEFQRQVKENNAYPTKYYIK